MCFIVSSSVRAKSVFAGIRWSILQRSSSRLWNVFVAWRQPLRWNVLRR